MNTNIKVQAILLSRKEVSFKAKEEDRMIEYVELKFLVEGKEGEAAVLTLRPRQFDTPTPKFSDLCDGELVYGILEYRYDVNERTGTAKPKIVSFEV